jgi:2-haloacid dehalogenase
MRVDALLFDAYGTLFDVHSIVEAARSLTDRPEALSGLWRQKQLEYTWLRSLMGRYEDFWAVTEAALAHACRRLEVPADGAARARLLDVYHRLAPFPEVPATLARLRGLPRGILSNGSPAMLARVVRHAGLEADLDPVISVDAVRVYKPAPAVYALGPARLNRPASAIGFVSSNAWDVAGAKAFGYQVAWVNRQGAPAEELGVAPDLEVPDLAALARALGR